MSDAAAEEANQSEEEPEIIADENKNRKIAAEALKKLAEMKIFTEVNGSDHLNIIFNEVVRAKFGANEAQKSKAK